MGNEGIGSSGWSAETLQTGRRGGHTDRVSGVDMGLYRVWREVEGGYVRCEESEADGEV